MGQSIWTDTVSLPEFDAFNGEAKTDVLIIGGGICGLLCAHFLGKANIPFYLLEADKLASGVTKNTTAKITSSHGLCYHKLIKKVGWEKAKQYLDANQAAIQKYRELAEYIPCEFENQKSYVYTTRDPLLILEETAALQSLGIPASYVGEHTPLQDYLLSVSSPLHPIGSVMFPDQAQFHPLLFLQGIIEDLCALKDSHIFEHSLIHTINDHTAHTNQGSITAKKIIVATHFPFMNKHGNYFLKLYQERPYVLALKGVPKLDGMYIDEQTGGFSFRNYRDYLLLGGNAHRTGHRGDGWETLRDFAQNAFPDSKEEYAWAAQDCMTLDDIPYIGFYSASTPDVFVATGFQKWGMTTSMVAAMILTYMVQEKENEWQSVFSPQRSMLKPQLAKNAAEAVIHLLTPTQRRCSHMGCALKWNDVEHTFDCPCHGSRYKEDGTLIDNPAKKDASI